MWFDIWQQIQSCMFFWLSPVGKNNNKKRQLKALPSSFLKLMMLFPEAVSMKTGVICWHLLRSVFVPVWVCVCVCAHSSVVTFALVASISLNKCCFIFWSFSQKLFTKAPNQLFRVLWTENSHLCQWMTVRQHVPIHVLQSEAFIDCLQYNMSENINKYPKTSNSNETCIKLVRVPEQRPGKICCYQF